MAHSTLNSQESMANSIFTDSMSSFFSTPPAGMHSTITHHPSTRSPNPSSASSSQEADSAAGSEGPTTRGPLIGMYIGIAVVVVLTVIAIGFCVYDCRRRVKKREIAKRERRETDCNMWETELRNGRSGQRKDEGGGLWDMLKVGETRLREEDNAPSSIPENRKLAMATEHVEDVSTEARSDAKVDVADTLLKKDSNIDSRYEREPEWLPAYRPREGSSSTYSAGTFVIPTTNMPIIPNILHVRDDTRVG